MQTRNRDLINAEIVHVYNTSKCLYDEKSVQRALDSMAEKITDKLKNTYPLVISVMSGAIVPTGQLLPRLNFHLETDYVHVTRYGNKTNGGKLSWIAKPHVPLEDRTVLIIDDILDGGVTMDSV